MLTVGIDTYITEDDFVVWATARGFKLELEPAVGLTRAMDYLSLQPWVGDRTDAYQTLDFPRDGEWSVPQQIIRAQCELALLYDSGTDPMAPVGPDVKREKVDVLEIEYQDGAGSVTSYPAISRLLSPWLPLSRGGVNFDVRRG